MCTVTNIIRTSDGYPECYITIMATLQSEVLHSYFKLVSFTIMRLD